MITDDGRTLIDQFIERDPDRPGPAEARLIVSGVPVWALIGHLRAVDGDVWQTTKDYDVPEAAVMAAIVYYRQHTTDIDARIRRNIATVA